MRNPNEGWLVAEIGGVRCEFDGTSWSCPDVQLAQWLNRATERAVSRKPGIRTLAEQVLIGLDFPSFEIVSCENEKPARSRGHKH